MAFPDVYSEKVQGLLYFCVILCDIKNMSPLMNFWCIKFILILSGKAELCINGLSYKYSRMNDYLPSFLQDFKDIFQEYFDSQLDSPHSFESLFLKQLLYAFLEEK